MHAQRPYILPIKGLKNGLHTYSLVADDSFFASFPESPVQQAAIQLTLNVDKRPSSMVAHFVFSGTIKNACDRCLAVVDFPVSGEEELLFQFTNEENPTSDDPSLVLVSFEAHELNVAPYAYEFFLLSLPMVNIFDCQVGEPPYPCDEELLAKLYKLQEEQAKEEAENSKDGPSPWDALKDFNKN